MDRCLLLAGSPETVWPWLEQLGKNRGGWYLTRAVERFIPPSRRAARTIEPRRLGLRRGDEIPDWGPGDPTFTVLEIERAHHLVYWSQRPRKDRGGTARPPIKLTWALVLTALGPTASRLDLRLRLDLGNPPGPIATYGGGAMDRLTVWLLGKGLNERLRDGA